MASTCNNHDTKTTPILPTDIIAHEILPTLPTSTIVRFMCVSTFYKSLTSSPRFIDQHLRQSLASDANRSLIFIESSVKYGKFYKIDLDSIDATPTDFDRPLLRSLIKWWEKESIISILGSLNGLLCLQIKESKLKPEWTYKHMLINPLTGVYLNIPCEVPEYWATVNGPECFGFGFDDINHDYKLVRIVKTTTQGDRFGLVRRQVMVYSTKSNTWKLVEQLHNSTTSLETEIGVLMKNHLLHWVVKSSNMFHIHCFDVRSDEWADEVPLMNFPKKHDELSLGVLHDCLCVYTTRTPRQFAPPDDGIVWIMKEYGAKESWIKLFSIFGNQRSIIRYYDPFKFELGSNCRLACQEAECEEYFSESLPMKGTEKMHQFLRSIPTLWGACFYKESFVSIPRARKF